MRFLVFLVPTLERGNEKGDSEQVSFGQLDKVLAQPNTQLRLFGKPAVAGKRRMGVVLARVEDVESARRIACDAVDALEVTL